jgi:hypothetical protein
VIRATRLTTKDTKVHEGEQTARQTSHSG